MNIWEDIKSIEPEKNSLSNNVVVENGITKGTLNVLGKNECESTGLTRKCPRCDNVITYTDKYTCKYAERDKRPCRKCKEHDPIMLKRLQQGNVGRKRSPEHIEKVRQSRLGKKHTDAWKEQASIRNKGKKCQTGTEIRLGYG